MREHQGRRAAQQDGDLGEELWLRRRGSDVEIKVRRGDRVAELSGSGDLDIARLVTVLLGGLRGAESRAAP